MKEPDGSWIAEPPSYEPIVAEGKCYNNAIVIGFLP